MAAVLDFLAKTIDSLLKLVQDIYNGLLTVVGMLVSGQFAELLQSTAPSPANRSTPVRSPRARTEQPRYRPKPIGRVTAAIATRTSG